VTSLVVVDAEIDDRPGRAVRIEGERIVAVGATAEIDRTGAEVLDARGGAVLPGLHDHHLHLLGLAARLESVDLGAAADAAAADALLRAAVATMGASLEGAGWVRAAGYDEHRHGPLDRARLDALTGARPLRVQHRTGLSWTVSTAGLEALGLDVGPGPDALRHDPVPDERSGQAPGAAGAAVERTADGTATGRLHRLDGWLGTRVGRAAPALAPVGALLASFGITGVTDTTPWLDDGRLALLRDAAVSGALQQRLTILGRAEAADLGDWAVLGPVKLVADEHVGLDVERMAAAVGEAHDNGRAAAIHCATRAECVAAVTALVVAGPMAGDRLEHAFVLPRDFDPMLAEAGVTVVAQPALIHERGDHHLASVEPDDLDDLYRLASLRAAGVRLAFGSDAPVTHPDPWVAIVSARDRTTRSGRVVGPDEALDTGAALAAYLGAPDDPGGPPRRVVPGEAADLCVLAVPCAEALASPSAASVRATLIRGTVVHG